MSESSLNNKRSTADDDDIPASQPPANRQRKNGDSLICCITHLLPVDPVVAEDGQIYDRDAIQEYFNSKEAQGGHRVPSPVTREDIRPVVFPVPQIKNTIDILIENGAIDGEPAKEWKTRLQEKEDMKKARQRLFNKAEGGHVWSMEHVAMHYCHGRDGFKKDWKEGYKWYDKARLAGSVFGLAKVGDLLTTGLGGTRDVEKGLMYLGMAEGRGSDLAAYVIGLCLADGRHGVPMDKVEARRLLEKSLSGSYKHKHMNANAKASAQKMLDELVSGSA